MSSENMSGCKENTLKTVSIFIADGNWIESKDQSNSGIRLIQTGNIGVAEYLDKANRAKYISNETFEKLNCTEVIPGDILISRLPDPIGRACCIPKGFGKSITAVDCTIVRLNNNICDSDYFVYYTCSEHYKLRLSNFISGSTRDRISRKNLENIEIPLPPLSEQKQIAKVLDELFERIEKAKANINKNIENAEEMFQSKLNEYFSVNKNEWVEFYLKDVTSKIGSGATPLGGKSSYKESGISLIRSMNVYDSGFDEKNLAHIDEEQAEKLNNVTVFENDILLNITGASIARCCIVPKEYLPARVNQHVSIIRLKDKSIEPEFIHYSLISKENKKKLIGIGESGGSTRQALTKTQIGDFKIKSPLDVKDQIKVLDDVNNFRRICNDLKDKYTQKLIALDELKKAALEKAFRGELT